ncbi:MAG: DNA polymerase III subunit alpha [Alphaproteobacteria bacterium MarineAlpha5_Bin12]|nr:MAG: DNA polymerase III subunit alpha [Alphaproteobacteria bacterium MarineAlpha5_Bin12]|tara:strand:- start:68690 stop:72121 length:3432 start_codon:yes stop_codon:yes gene_type:complete
MIMEKCNFIHLRTKSSYSLSQGAIKIDKLVHLTKSYNMPAVALTDDNNMFGALEFSMECFNQGIQPIIGSCINLLDNNSSNSNNFYKNIPQISIIAKNELGFENLLALSSKSHIESKFNIPGITIDDIVNYREGLILYLGGINNPILHDFKLNKYEKIKEFIEYLKKKFDGNIFFEIQRIQNQDIDNFETDYINLAIDNNIPLIATNDVQFPDPDYYDAHDSLICISDKKTINQENRVKSNPNSYFKNPIEMNDLFFDIPESIKNTCSIALKCNFAPTKKNPRLPKFISNNNLSEDEELYNQSHKGLENKILSNKLDKKIYNQRLDYELEVIKKMGFSGYFLIVSDFINWAKSMGIPVGPGRGSGAGSLVAWSLKITDLNPIKYGLIFERFLNPERKSLPDFDIDFCQERREEVIDYVSSKYGENSVAHIISFGTLKPRAVIRDLGRVHSIPYNEVDSFSKILPYNAAKPMTLSESIEIEPLVKQTIKKDERIKIVIDQALKLEGLYRHASTHAAGVVISDQNLQKIIPLYKDPKTEKINTQYSMDFVELAGLIKFDFLGLTTLTVIDQAVNLIKKYKKDFKLQDIPLDDPKTFEMLSSGRTTGVFQLESNGMKDVLKRLKPDRFEDIIAVVALFRPGPMDNIPSFCNRKNGIEKIEYLHQLLEPVLKETYGIIVYQEQVMQIAQILSGYSMGEADILRKAMGKKITKEMKNQKDKFINGSVTKGLKKNQAAFIFDLIDKFAGYGFNKCHAVGYALIAYQTAYLKAHFPEEFLVSSMNLSINKTENLVMFKKEIDENKINFLKPDINFSDANFKIEIDKKNIKSIRFGLAAIKGVGYNAMLNLKEERKKSKYKNIFDFITRLKSDVINKKQLEKLIQSGSFDSIEKNRSFLFNNVEKLIKIANNINKNKLQSSLFNEDQNIENFDNILEKFDDWKDSKKLQYELDAIGFYFSKHPLSFYSKELFNILNISSLEDINNNNLAKAIIVGSILDIQERTSKDGNKYAFITISDENNQYDLTIFGDSFNNNKKYIKEGQILIFKIDITSTKERSKRLIVKEIHSLNEYINKFNLKHKIFINNISEIDLIKNKLTEKKPNFNKLILIYSKNNYDISISLGENTTFEDELDFNNLLKSNGILRELSIIN